MGSTDPRDPRTPSRAQAGGLYILSETVAGSLRKLNALRELADLTPLPMHAFNSYLEEEVLESFFPELFTVTAVEQSSSPYYVATRFQRELTTQPDEPVGYNASFNKFGASLAATPFSGDFGIQEAYVLRKRGGD